MKRDSSDTLSERVYRDILDRLLKRGLRPGDFVDRKKLAGDLEVSLIPVSEAIQKLTHQGFLYTRPRKGTFVSSPSLEDVRGQQLLREALECQVARLLCGNQIREARDTLLPLAEAADATADAGEPLWRDDYAFHEALVNLAGYEALNRCFKQISNLSMFYETAVISPMQQASYDRHVTLLNDLADSEPGAAEERMRNHIRFGKDSLFKAIP